MHELSQRQVHITIPKVLSHHRSECSYHIKTHSAIHVVKCHECFISGNSNHIIILFVETYRHVGSYTSIHKRCSLVACSDCFAQLASYTKTFIIYFIALTSVLSAHDLSMIFMD